MPSTGDRPPGSSVVANSSRSGSVDTESSAPWPCSSSAMAFWSCAAVPSRTAPDSTEARAVCTPRRRAVGAANGTRSRSSISGTPGRGTTTTRRPLGSVVSSAAGTGWGRGSPSGGTRDRSSCAVIERPPVARSSSTAAVSGSSARAAVCTCSGVTAASRAAISPASSARPWISSAAAKARVRPSTESAWRSSCASVRACTRRSSSAPTPSVAIRAISSWTVESTVSGPATAGRVVDLGGEQGRVADVERVAEEAHVAALRDRDAVAVHQPALQAGGVALAEQLGEEHGAQVACRSRRPGRAPASRSRPPAPWPARPRRHRSGPSSAAVRPVGGTGGTARASTGPNQRCTSRSVSATSRSPPMQRTALPGA